MAEHTSSQHIANRSYYEDAIQKPVAANEFERARVCVWLTFSGGGHQLAEEMTECYLNRWMGTWNVRRGARRRSSVPKILSLATPQAPCKCVSPVPSLAAADRTICPGSSRPVFGAAHIVPVDQSMRSGSIGSSMSSMSSMKRPSSNEIFKSEF